MNNFNLTFPNSYVWCSIKLFTKVWLNKGVLKTNLNIWNDVRCLHCDVVGKHSQTLNRSSHREPVWLHCKIVFLRLCQSVICVWRNRSYVLVEVGGETARDWSTLRALFNCNSNIDSCALSRKLTVRFSLSFVDMRCRSVVKLSWENVGLCHPKFSVGVRFIKQ